MSIRRLSTAHVSPVLLVRPRSDGGMGRRWAHSNVVVTACTNSLCLMEPLCLHEMTLVMLLQLDTRERGTGDGQPEAVEALALQGNSAAMHEIVMCSLRQAPAPVGSGVCGVRGWATSPSRGSNESANLEIAIWYSRRTGARRAEAGRGVLRYPP